MVAEQVKMKDVVQYKSVDVSVYKRNENGATPGNDGHEVWDADVSGVEADLAKTLIGMIVAQERPLTICLNGKWGTGKTFFLTRLVETYRNSGGTALYYNAWQDDFLDDPLVSIIAQLDSKNIAAATFAAVKKVARPRWGVGINLKTLV